jgi:hypothetical protein
MVGTRDEATTMEKVRLKKVGFWRRCADWTNCSGWVEAYPELRQPEHHPELPEAKDHVDPSWDRNERALVLAYVTDKKFEDEAYDGWSECRICNEMNGSHDFTDGTYIWPEGFGHYISEHDVKPPQSFIDHVLSVMGPSEP